MAPVTVAPTRDRFLRGGKPFFYLADTAWMAFSNVPEALWTEYVRYRREQGFTALQISMLPVNHDTSVAPTNDAPFAPRRGGGWDYGARNGAYFDKAERMVAEAAAAGLVPVLGVLWRNYVPGTRSSTANPVAGPMPFDVMEQYAAHIAQRFRPYEPMFFISGDTLWESEDEPRYYLRALELIRAGCPDALISMHLTPQADLPDQFVDAVDFYLFQSGHGAGRTDLPWRLAEKFAAYRIQRPVINSEPCYEGHGRVSGARQVHGQWTRSEVRAAAWQSLLSGAKAGVTYGGHGVWSFHTREKRFLNDHKYVPMDWWEALRLPGAWDYAYARWLFETFGLADLTPNQNLVTGADPAIRAAASADGGVVAVYLPHAVGVEVDADLSRHRITLLDLERRLPYATDVTVVEGRTRLQLPNTMSDLLLIAVRPG